MASKTSLRRSGRRGALSRGSKGSPPNLAAGFAGLSHLAGNKALIGMLARKRSATEVKFTDDDTTDLEAVEEKLAQERVALDELERVLDEIGKRGKISAKERGGLLLAIARAIDALDDALGSDPRYDGKLGEQLEVLERLERSPKAKQSDEWLLQLGALVRQTGEGIHGKLAKQLPAPGVQGTPQVKAPKQELDALIKEIKEIAREAEKPEASEKKDVKKQLAAANGGGKLDELLAAAKKRRRK